jgi:hypothetical protein
LALVSSLNTSLTEAQIEALAGNLPDTYSGPIDKIASLASALPLSCFDSASPRELLTLIKNRKLELSLIDDTRKIYIATTVFKNIIQKIIFKLIFFFLQNKI